MIPRPPAWRRGRGAACARSNAAVKCVVVVSLLLVLLVVVVVLLVVLMVLEVVRVAVAASWRC